MLTEQSRCRERAACVLISCRCGSTNDHRDLLKFVQEVARFVTSRFFGEKVTGGSENSLSCQHCMHLYYSPLSLSDCSSTRIFKRTPVQEYLDHGQSEGGLPFTISDWFRPRYWPNVCLLLNHRKTFRVTETFFSFLEWLVAPVRPHIFVLRFVLFKIRRGNIKILTCT